MKQNKKGFTLIELLAVIIILGIIAVITVPVVLSVIGSNKEDIYQQNEKTLASMADVYMAHEMIAPPEPGSKVIVTLDQMKTIGIANDLYDPRTGATCNGYVEIEKTIFGVESITPYLSCGTNYATIGYEDIKNPLFLAYGDGSYEYFNTGAVHSNGYVAVGETMSNSGDFLDQHHGFTDAMIADYDLNGNLNWAKTYGGTINDYFKGVASDGNYRIAVGYSNSTNYDLNSMNKGGWDGIIVKYDSTGNIVWKKNFGHTGTEVFFNLAVVSDGYVVVGYTDSSAGGDLTGTIARGGSDAILVKFDKSGNLVWTKRIGGGSTDQFVKVSSNSNSIVAIGNSLSNTNDFVNLHYGTQGSSNDAIITKFDLNGNLVWTKNFGGNNHDYFEGIAATEDSYVAVGHALSNDLDLLNLHYNTTGTYDAIIVKYNLDGTVSWKKNFGANDHDYAHAVSADATGYTFFGRSYYNNTYDMINKSKGGWDGYIARFDLNGNKVWNYNYGGGSTDYFYGGAATTDGYIGVGSSYSSDQNMAGKVVRGADATIFKIDSTGNFIWAKNTGGGPGADYLYNVTPTKTGFAVVGSSETTVSIFRDKNKGWADGIIISYDLSGNILWNNNYGGTSNDYFWGVTSDTTGIVAVGYSISNNFDLMNLNKGGWDGIIVKYGFDGSIIWKKNFGGGSADVLYDVIAVSDGYVAVGYSYSSTNDLVGLHYGPQGSYMDAIISKFDLNGNLVWVKNFGGGVNDLFYGVTEGPDGYVAVGYSASNDYNLTNKHTGTTSYFDGIVAKFSKTGELIWSDNIGGNHHDYLKEVVYTGSGYAVVGYSYSIDGDFLDKHHGTTTSYSDGFIAFYDLNGNMSWLKNFGGTSNDTFTSVVYKDGFIIAGGRGESTDRDMYGYNRGYAEAMIIKYDKNGNLLNKKNYGGSGYDEVLNMAIVRNGYVMAGTTSSINYDLQNINTVGETDLFIATHKY